MEKKREPGYYWVKKDDVWRIAYWSMFSRTWLTINTSLEYKDSEWSEIDERPITRDSQPPRV